MHKNGNQSAIAHAWSVRFQTLKPLPALPQAQVLAGERIASTRYHHQGRYRQHERHCIFKYTLSGRGVFRDDRGEYAVPAGSGFLCEIRDPATAYYYPHDAGEPWHFVYLSFVGATAVAMVRDLLQRWGPVYRLPPDDPVLRRWLSYRTRDGEVVDLTPALGADLVTSLLYRLAEARVRSESDAPASTLVREALQLARRHWRDNLNATDLAARLGVSREHLGRTFREQTGTTPYRYILRQRMLQAARLLKETRLSTKAVAAELGYDTPAHFNRAFTRVMDMPPGLFREVGTVPPA